MTGYGYDAWGRLARVTLPGGVTVTYGYDPLGRRVTRSKGGKVTHRWLYRDSLTPVATLDAQHRVTARYVYGTAGHVPDLMVRGSASYRLIKDRRGSVHLVVDLSTGAITQRLRYAPFGRVLQDTHPGFQPFGFAGGQYDPDTGLVHDGARDYDPVTARWLTQDPIRFAGGDPNLYAYVRNDPINAIDPTGLCADIAADAGFVAWDTYKIITDPCNRALYSVALLLDIAGAAMPLVTGLGPAYVAAKTSAHMCTHAMVQVQKHHTVPREILRDYLEPDVAGDPNVRGKRGAPNRWPIPTDIHKKIHRGKGGGRYNEALKDALDELEHTATARDVIEIRDRLAKAFGLESYRP